MESILPTNDELERLTMRSLVAYVARSAHRLSAELRDIVAHDALDEALQFIDQVAVTDALGQIDRVAIVRASEQVAGAYASSTSPMKSPERFRVVFSLANAAFTAIDVIEAAVNPRVARGRMRRAVHAAQRSVRVIEVFDRPIGHKLAEAARSDFTILLRTYGRHDDVVIGDPVLCFENGGSNGE